MYSDRFTHLCNQLSSQDREQFHHQASFSLFPASQSSLHISSNFCSDFYAPRVILPAFGCHINGIINKNIDNSYSLSRFLNYTHVIIYITSLCFIAK